ncbi:hypothetical protein [Methylorubrum extorquens]|nr:hypothetical protein [Methylorubrum extorquens]MCP1538914.1 hypothetical protein [Methylorubrum extorquens]
MSILVAPMSFTADVVHLVFARHDKRGNAASESRIRPHCSQAGVSRSLL